MLPTDPSSLALDVAGVAKTYGRGRKRVQALRGIDMHIVRGEIFGLLGPNGAGKSTLVKILMTVIRPSRVSGHMLGAPVGHKGTLARVGYLPEHHKFPEYLTGAQVLDYFAALSNVPRPERRRRAGELLELVGMSQWAKTRVRGYSKGMRQRLGVAQALMNDPDLVVLDEPTDGVDPVGRRDIRNVLVEMKSRGKTVLVNSHLLSELEMVCDRVAILVQGVVASQGTIDELTRSQQRYEIELELEPGPMAHEAITRSLLPGAPSMAAPAPGDISAPGVGLARRVELRGQLATGETIELERATLRIATIDPHRVQPVVDALRARQVVIKAIRPVRPSLEDLFIQAVTDPNTGETLKPGADRRNDAAPPTNRTGGRP